MEGKQHPNKKTMSRQLKQQVYVAHVSREPPMRAICRTWTQIRATWPGYSSCFRIVTVWQGLFIVNTKVLDIQCLQQRSQIWDLKFGTPDFFNGKSHKLGSLKFQVPNLGPLLYKHWILHFSKTCTIVEIWLLIRNLQLTYL